MHEGSIAAAARPATHAVPHVGAAPALPAAARSHRPAPRRPCERRPAAAATDSTVATIILVRHAERDTLLIGPDHPLRATGVLRAQELVHTLGASGISYHLRDAVASESPDGDAARDRARGSRSRSSTRSPRPCAGCARHFGQTVLVVGHSNTVPDISRH